MPTTTSESDQALVCDPGKADVGGNPKLASVSMSDLDITVDDLDEASNYYAPSPSCLRSPPPVLGASALLASSTPKTESNESLPILNHKPYDYLLKVLLVGDSDVGKQEILAGLEDGTTDSPFCSSSSGAAYKTTTILIDGKRVKLQLWDTSGQGRFCTIIRSYSRGAQGILLVYDITNKWSFEGIDRWLKEVDQVKLTFSSFHNTLNFIWINSFLHYF